MFLQIANAYIRVYEAIDAKSSLKFDVILHCIYISPMTVNSLRYMYTILPKIGQECDGFFVKNF